MMKEKTEKFVFILEGSDCSGKTSLMEYLTTLCNHHCHTIHSNYDKTLPKANHFRQHKIITKFVKNILKDRNYTGNNFVILDRNYISDIVYGAIGYGSKGDFEQKLKNLYSMLCTIRTIDNVNIVVVYCNPSQNTFEKSDKDELPTVNQHKKIDEIYKNFFNDIQVKCMFHDLGIKLYHYDYITDPDYDKFYCDIFNATHN